MVCVLLFWYLEILSHQSHSQAFLVKPSSSTCNSCRSAFRASPYFPMKTFLTLPLEQIRPRSRQFAFWWRTLRRRRHDWRDVEQENSKRRNLTVQLHLGYVNDLLGNNLNFNIAHVCYSCGPTRRGEPIRKCEEQRWCRHKEARCYGSSWWGREEAIEPEENKKFTEQTWVDFLWMKIIGNWYLWIALLSFLNSVKLYLVKFSP